MVNKEFSAPFDTNLYNLKSLSSESAVLSLRRSCEISEMCDIAATISEECYKDGLGIYEILSVISEEFPLTGICDQSGISDRVTFSSLFLERIRGLGISLTEVSFLPVAMQSETFVYVKNHLSDEAYDVFSQEFSDPRVRYVGTIKEAVKAVNDGEVTYCLLPLEERGGARLSTVTELILGNDLKIDSVTPVFGQDGCADMKYALVSKAF